MNRWFGLVSMCLVVGCATARAEDKMETLRTAVEAYNHAFRWKNYERAASFLPRDIRALFVATHDDDTDSLHIEDYTVLKVDLDSEDAARVLVRYRYTLLPSVVVQTRKSTQYWHHVAGQWMLENEDDPIRPLDEKSIQERPEAFGGRADPVDTDARDEEDEHVFPDDEPPGGTPRSPLRERKNRLR